MPEHEPTPSTSPDEVTAPAAKPPRRRRSASRAAGPPQASPPPAAEPVPTQTTAVEPEAPAQTPAPVEPQAPVESAPPAADPVPAAETASPRTRTRRRAATRPAGSPEAVQPAAEQPVTQPEVAAEQPEGQPDEQSVEPTRPARKRAPRKRAPAKARAADPETPADPPAESTAEVPVESPVAETASTTAQGPGIPAADSAGGAEEATAGRSGETGQRRGRRSRPTGRVADPFAPVETPPATPASGTDELSAAVRAVFDQAGGGSSDDHTAAGDDEDETVAAEDDTRPEDETSQDDESQDDSEDDSQESADDTQDDGSGEDDDSDGSSRNRRRRRRGGRRRRRGGTDSDRTDSDRTDSDRTDSERPDSDSGEAGEGEAKQVQATGDGERADDGRADDGRADGGRAAEDDGSGDGTGSDEDTAEGSGEGGRRRRRRRRRRGEDSGAAEDDPSDTVTRVREPRRKRERSAADQITGIEGSTRLEAKRQRRRDGRSGGRRRTPILSEAEFLARRESVERTMIIRQGEDLSQLAVLEDGVLVEHYVDRESATSLIGNVYLARVQNVLPSMEAAFVDIGRGRNAVLYAGEVDWDAHGADKNGRQIEKVLKSGQTVLVQVTKDPVGAKGARLTNHISIPGRYVVYSPGGHLSGISRKLPEVERKRLKDILSELVGENASVIVRTAAEGASEDELVRDVNRLKAQWEAIEKKIKSNTAPQLLHAEPDLTLRIVRDLFTEDFAQLVVDGGNGASADAFDTVNDYVSHVAPHLADRLQRWDHEAQGDVFAAHRLDEQIAKAMDRKVFLPSGGSLIIDRTEAMTVIDVNTGKFTGSGGNLETTVTSNNLEAAEEIVRQLRLRDIGGIIVIDFIDMVLPSNRELLLRRLVECLGRDRTRHQVAEVTSLGLVQMTRKKIGTGLAEAFSEPCEHCGGLGYHTQEMPVATQHQADGGERQGRKGRSGRNKGGRGKDQGEADRSGSAGAEEVQKRNGGPQDVIKAMQAKGLAADEGHAADETQPSDPTPAEEPVAAVEQPIAAEGSAPATAAAEESAPATAAPAASSTEPDPATTPADGSLESTEQSPVQDSLVETSPDQTSPDETSVSPDETSPAEGERPA